MAVQLTETAINAATRRAAQQKQRIALTDPGQEGLQLRITANATRTWVLFCRDSNGRPRRFLLGQYPEIGLAQARLDARAMREQVRQGADPITASREKRAAVKAQRENPADTLADLLGLYERQRGGSLRTWTEYKRRIESVFGPSLRTGLAELRLGTLQMQADKWPKQQSAAAAVRYLRPILKWAAASGRAYVAKELTELTPPATVRRRQRVLSADELRAILPALAARDDAYAQALKFMLLTLARRDEVCGATWAEIDLSARAWTLPPERVKPDRPHRVPLSRQALALLHAIRPSESDGERLVFATATGSPLGNWDRETKRIHKATGTAGWHRHDLRRTATTLLGRNGVPPHVIKSALNHVHVADPVDTIYLVARYEREVSEALQLLADVLDGIAAGAATVVPLASLRSVR